MNLRDAGDPVEIAAAYDKAGADEVVFLDITASSDARNTVVDMVRKVAEKVFIPFTVGGGIRTVDDFKALLREGADKIAINSAAIMNPNLISEAADKLSWKRVLRIDLTNQHNDKPVYRQMIKRVLSKVLQSDGDCCGAKWKTFINNKLSEPKTEWGDPISAT